MHVKNIIGKAILAKFESIVFSLSLAYLTNKWDSSELAFILLPSDLTGLCDPPPFPFRVSLQTGSPLDGLFLGDACPIIARWP